jgi:predicted component of type VI protein secretion system
MPRLKITTGKQTGKSIDVAKATIIGRGETTQLQITDAHASREHCKVFEQAGAWVVADLNSRNGFTVNGVKTTRKNLANGDRIVIGETTIVFETTSAPASSAAPAAPSKASAAKEAAFAAARQGASAPAARSAPAAAPAKAAAAADGGVKVSDHVLQFNKVDAKTAGVLDIDLSQSAAMQTFFIWVACLAFLGGVVWLVFKMMG